MKQTIIAVIISLLSFNVMAQGIEFFHGSWEEALELAQKEEKVIFVAAYAQWCGPCKRMAKTTFKEQSVGDFFNANFINLKLDMEKGDGLKFRQKYPVSAFPTLFFLDPKGEVVHKAKGAQQADPLIKMGKFALSKVDYSADYAKLYEEGNREPELVYNYVKALNKSNKSSLKIANEYLMTHKDKLDTDFNQKFILEAASEADSRIFDLLIKNKSKIESLTSAQEVKDRIEKACKRTAQKAIEFESDDLLESAQAQMKKHYPENAAAFAASSDLNFYREMGDAKKYIKCCNNFVKKEAKNDAGKLHNIALEIKESFATNKEAMSVAEKVAKKAAEYGDKYDYYLTYSGILLDNGKKNEAIKAAKKSYEMAEGDKRAQMGIDRIIKKLEQG